jgi:hypothetical protein
MNVRAMFVGAAVALALALGGCGGGGGNDHSNSTAASTGTTGTETLPAQSGKQKPAESSTTGASEDSFTLGSPSDVPRTEGGDNSIQDFGSEASTADRVAAGRALAAYYEALAKGDTEEACAMLTSSTRQRIDQTLEQLRQQGGSGNALLEGCPQALKLSADVGSGGSPRLRLSELLSLRQQDEQSFLIYKAGDGKLYAMPMGQEGTEWKVGGVSAAPLGA